MQNKHRYIIDRPRDYHAVIMFTASAQQYQCSVCHMALTGFVEGAKAYHDQADFMEGASTVFADSTERQEAASKRVAFFVLEVDAARSTFNDMGLESVPRIYALPPTQEGSPKMRMQDFDIPVQVRVCVSFSLVSFFDFFHTNPHPLLTPNPPPRARFFCC